MPRIWRAAPGVGSILSAPVEAVQLSNGNLWLVWSTSAPTPADPFASEVRGQLYDPLGNSIGNAAKVGVTPRPERVAAAAVPGGGFVIAEAEPDSATVGLVVRGADGALQWNIAAAGVQVDSVDVAVAGPSAGLLVYERLADAKIVGHLFDPASGTLIGNPIDIWPAGAQAGSVRVEALAGGNFAVVWEENSTSGSAADFDVRAALYSPAGALLRPLTPGFTNASEGQPSIAALPGGGFAVSYTSFSGAIPGQPTGNNNGDIFVKLYDADGDQVRTIAVATGTAAQRQSQVVATADGGFVVSWDDQDAGTVSLRTYGSDGAPVGDALVLGAANGAEERLLLLGDGRIAVARPDASGAAALILVDPRAAPNAPPVYTGTSRQVGTPDADVFTIDGSAGHVHGWSGDDVITDAQGATSAFISGDDGNDRIIMNGLATIQGADGGAGVDTLEMSSSFAAVTIDLAAGFASHAFGQNMVATGFENFTDTGNRPITAYGTAGANTIRTSSAADVIDGREGDDLIESGGGADRLTGGGGNDELDAGAGDDDLDLSGGGDDEARGGDGDDGFYFGGAFTNTDRVEGGAGSLDQLGLQGNYPALVFDANDISGVEFLVLLSGADTRFGAPGTASFDYNVTMNNANVAAGQQFVVTFNTLRAGEDATFNGAAELDGNFLTYGGQGVDLITGGQQSDGFYFGGDGRFASGDRVDGQGGALDQFGLQGDYSGANALTLAADALSGIEMIVLLSAGDTRFGGGAATGFSYDLTLDNGNIAAGQTMYVSANTLKDNGTLSERMRLDASAELDGRLIVYGGDGEDIIIGGRGADEFSGRGGNDRFEYTDVLQSTGAARDLIRDFASGDKIDLSALDANAGASGGQQFSVIDANAAFTSAGQLRISGGNGNWLIEGETTGDGAADLVIAVTTVDPNYQLGSSDFFFT